MSKNKVIALSGIDCAGKSTQIDLLSTHLERKRKVRVIWSRGGYTPGIEFVKNIIKRTNKVDSNSSKYRDEVHSSEKKRKLLLWASIADLCLYYGVYFRLIKITGCSIIADRYLIDSLIDFKLKYPEFEFEDWFIWKILILIYCKPDLSIVMTINAEESMRRSELKVEPFPETLDERTTRISTYETMIEERKWMHVIDASSSIEVVFSKIKALTR